jgi:DNA-directed RNA polymerase specialized sigma24 family protein
MVKGMTQSDDSSGYQESRLPTESPAQDIFDQALTEILGKDNPRAVSILSSVQRTLNQYRLTAHLEAYEVLHEAYLRGKKKLQSGETIHNGYAWLRKTAFHVIYERRRKYRAGGTEPHILEATILDERVNLLQQLIAGEEINILYRALEILSQEDPDTTRSLCLKMIHGWSWSDIRECLVAEGQVIPNEATLRQRASRAKRRLREIVKMQMSESRDLSLLEAPTTSR